MLFLLFLFSTINQGIVKGFVSDASNGEKLLFANVYLKDAKIGTATNKQGYYILQNIPEGRYQFVVSYLGYEKFTREIEIRQNTVISLNVELKPTVIKGKEVIVTAQRTRFEKNIELSRITFSQAEIRAIPTFIEADLMKIIQLMPGVVSMHGLSNKLYIRGGSPDENLVLLDGITVYNPSTHLFGLFSTFNPDAVASTELISGGFPAQYGDRLSAVLDVTTKEGNSKEFTSKASVSLISSKLLIEGPIPKGSFLFSGRRTYFDLVAWGLSKIRKGDIQLPYYFYDGIGKVNYDISPDNRFTWAGLGGADVINFKIEEDSEQTGKVNLQWGNQGTSLKWRKVIHPKLYAEMLGAVSNFFTRFGYVYSYYNSEKEKEDKQELSLDQGILDYTLKVDFTSFPSTHHTIDFGLEVKKLKFTTAWEFKDEDATEETYKESISPTSFACYFQDKWEITPILYIQPGVRGIYYYLKDDYKIELDPRIRLRYRFRENTALAIAGGKYSQFLTTLNSQESYFSIFDFWIPLSEEHTPPTAYHCIAGIEQWLGDDEKFTIEGYYKKYNNLLIPCESDIFFSFPSESLKVGNGYSLGLEVFLKKSFRNFYGWVGYTLGFTRRRLQGKSYFPRYDRRHNLNIVTGSSLPDRIFLIGKATLNFRWYFATGLPFAADLARYSIYVYDFRENEVEEGFWSYIKGPRDAHRYPVSHRLDMHIEKNIKIFGLNGSWYIDVMNLYAHKNILFYDYQYEDPKTGEELDPPKREEVSLLPWVIPSFGITINF